MVALAGRGGEESQKGSFSSETLGRLLLRYLKMSCKSSPLQSLLAKGDPSRFIGRIRQTHQRGQKLIDKLQRQGLGRKVKGSGTRQPRRGETSGEFPGGHESLFSTGVFRITSRSAVSRSPSRRASSRPCLPLLNASSPHPFLCPLGPSTLQTGLCRRA